MDLCSILCWTSQLCSPFWSLQTAISLLHAFNVIMVCSQRLVAFFLTLHHFRPRLQATRSGGHGSSVFYSFTLQRRLQQGPGPRTMCSFWYLSPILVVFPQGVRVYVGKLCENEPAWMESALHQTCSSSGPDPCLRVLLRYCGSSSGPIRQCFQSNPPPFQ